MNEDILRFKYGPGKIVVRPIISQDETMTIYDIHQQQKVLCMRMVQMSILFRT